MRGLKYSVVQLNGEECTEVQCVVTQTSCGIWILVLDPICQLIKKEAGA